MTPDIDSPEAIAKHRFQLIGAIRICSAILAATGFALWKSDVFGVTAPNVGRVTLGVGLFLMLVVPALLLRKWRRPA